MSTREYPLLHISHGRGTRPFYNLFIYFHPRFESHNPNDISPYTFNFIGRFTLKRYTIFKEQIKDLVPAVQYYHIYHSVSHYLYIKNFDTNPQIPTGSTRTRCMWPGRVRSLARPYFLPKPAGFDSDLTFTQMTGARPYYSKAAKISSNFPDGPTGIMRTKYDSYYPILLLSGLWGNTNGELAESEFPRFVCPTWNAGFMPYLSRQKASKLPN